MKNTKAKARVQVTIEIECTSSWGDDCQVGQIYKQAADEALAFLNKLPPGRVTLVDHPKVIGIAFEDKR